MPNFPRVKVQRLFTAADNATIKQKRGALLEMAIRLLFETVPGVEAEESNVINAANTEEVDIVFWNERRERGLYFLETPFLAECKNWSGKVRGQEIVYFKN